MPTLRLSDHTATVTWLGRVPHRHRAEIDGINEARLDLRFGGAVGEVHAGVTRPACARVAQLHPRGTEIANVRQLTILSAEELDAIARDMGCGALDPAWLGASVVVSGVPDLSHLSPASRLQAPGGATLVVDMLNRPCNFPALTIAAAVDGSGQRFEIAARGRRGVTAWVERPGALRIGDRLKLFVPDQRAWAP